MKKTVMKGLPTCHKANPCDLRRFDEVFEKIGAWHLYVLRLKSTAPRLPYALPQCIFALRNATQCVVPSLCAAPVAQCAAPPNPMRSTFCKRL